MAKHNFSPMDALMAAFTLNHPVNKLSLKQKGEAIEQARDFYRKGDYINCAQSLLTISDDPLIAPIDIATRMLGFAGGFNCNNQPEIEIVQEMFLEGLQKIKQDMSYNKMSHGEQLKAYLTTLIQISDKTMFLKFLEQEKSSNALAQLEEAMPADVFARMLSMFNHGDHEVSTLGEDGKEDSDVE